MINVNMKQTQKTCKHRRKTQKHLETFRKLVELPLRIRGVPMGVNIIVWVISVGIVPPPSNSQQKTRRTVFDCPFNFGSREKRSHFCLTILRPTATFSGAARPWPGYYVGQRNLDIILHFYYFFVNQFQRSFILDPCRQLRSPSKSPNAQIAALG